jgi:serine/threonine protein phosphatase 1
MGKTFVIGDIHGAWIALQQCFERSSFDRNHDRLISLGDACDGWPQVYEVIEELLKVKHLVYILGNHDQWTLEWVETGNEPYIWLSQGGQATIESYKEGVPLHHVRFLSAAKTYHQEGNILFVHGGLDTGRKLADQETEVLLWDRSLAMEAFDRSMENPAARLTRYKEIYLGHTPTLSFGSTEPLHACECWLMDTGAGWSGCLTMMDIATKEFFQSDPAPSLYPDCQGRF